MKTTEIKAALSSPIYKFSKEFHTLYMYKEEYTRVKYLIKSLASRKGNDEIGGLLTQIKKIVLGTAVNGGVKLAMLRATKRDNETVMNTMAKVDKAIAKLTVNVERLLTALVMVYVKSTIPANMENIIKQTMKCIDDVKGSYIEANAVLVNTPDKEEEASVVVCERVSNEDNTDVHMVEETAVALTTEAGTQTIIYNNESAGEGEDRPLPHIDLLSGVEDITYDVTDYKQAI